MGDLLAPLLPVEPDVPGAPFPPWDARREYCAANVAVFYRSHVSAPLPPAQAWSWVGAAARGEDGGPPPPKPSGKPQKWVHVPLGATLAEALAQADHVIPDVPVLYVIARTGKFYAALMEKLPGGVFAEMAPVPGGGLPPGAGGSG